MNVLTQLAHLPRLKKSLAVSFPIPELAPVIIAVFPSRRVLDMHFALNNPILRQQLEC
jgi:hypothetical protein